MIHRHQYCDAGNVPGFVDVPLRAQVRTLRGVAWRAPAEGPSDTSTAPDGPTAGDAEMEPMINDQ